MGESDGGYNGWTNRATWCAALWLGNDEGLYRAACAGMDPIELLAAHPEAMSDLRPDTLGDVNWQEIQADFIAGLA